MVKSLKIPYLRGSNTGNFNNIQAEADYGGIVAVTDVGIQNKQEQWNIRTIPMEPAVARRLHYEIIKTFGHPFDWIDKPTGASAKFYWVRPMKIEWIPQGAMVSLAMQIENYPNLL